jgi:two-component system sensor histidine kinase/response regulator
MLTDAPAAPRPRVLVVDDNAANRELLRSILEDEVEVLEASDGTTAIAFTEAWLPDLVLLDVMMPDTSGYTVCRKLRSLRGGEHLPILLVTSLADDGERIQGFRAGADDFITKPFNTYELRLRVRAFLRSRRLFLERQVLLEDLQRLHDLKDDLAALLVHDLRNPLTGLMGHLGLLEELVVTDIERESVKAATLASQRLRELIDDLLQVRLLEDNAYEVTRTPHELASVVGDAAKTMQGAAIARGMTICLDTAASRQLSCEPTLLRRAVENLLANAIRHAPKDSEVLVRIAESSGALVLTVEDAGPGIPDDERPILFTKYGSKELRRGGRRTGHGLGLYLVSLVMRAHGGTVKVDAERRAGTSVVMTFPL